jgi:chemotaxis-related protein WspB
MQLLTFSIAGEPYAIESRQVVEVLPLVPARPLPRAPDYLVGIFTYRGHLVPLIDLARRLGVAPAAQRLSTRVIVVELEAEPPTAGAAEAGMPDPKGSFRFGLIAENVVAIRSTNEAEASLPPLRMPDAAYLGRMLRIAGETVQLIDIRQLLPAELRASLTETAEDQP